MGSGLEGTSRAGHERTFHAGGQPAAGADVDVAGRAGVDSAAEVETFHKVRAARAFAAPGSLYLLLLVLALLVAMVVAAGVGSAPIPPLEVVSILLHRLPFMSENALHTNWPLSHEVILLQVRLPRILLAVMVGASLAAAGAALQGLLRNPLADPYIVGVSAGAALGATIAMVAGLPTVIMGIGSVPIFAFLAAVATMVIVYSLARVSGRLPADTFLLAGVVVGSFLWALISFLMVLAGDDLRQIVMWLMGSLSNKGYAHVKMAFPYVAGGIAALMVLARDFNLISLG
ncbi:MAG: iron chelate uptake ABC transporter family permease subunit, partial [Bacillota bacterium]